ncbi:dynein regulatory complex subunit 2 isoform X2 [Pogoniulus pusillus]|uniref:dynein regulatory complex subunit 2 isoform X2 n=1 Tax=Pogoniulus pusillus TaxID=488313 RepID=UPI0030B98E1E
MPLKKPPQAAAPMAAEDELLLLQKQALAEEEAAKSKGEMLSRFLKDKLAKEKHSSALNLHKLNAQWRAVLREARAEELQQDVEILSQTFARVMDGKDSVIESLATDLEEAEEQHAQALRSHLRNIDRLLRLQRCRLSCLQEGYEAQLEALKVEFEAERRAILEQQERESCSLQAMLLATEQHHSRNHQEAEQDLQSAQAVLKNKSMLEKQFSRAQVSNKLEVLWEQFRKAAQSYAEATEHPAVALRTLKQKDKKSSREISTQAKKLKKLQDLVTATKGQLAAHRWEREEQTQQGQEEKERAFRKLLELEGRMKQARTKARGDLARLILQSNTALKALGKVVAKAADGGGEGSALLLFLPGRGGAARGPTSPGGDTHRAPGPGLAGLPRTGALLAALQQGQAGGAGTEAGAGGPEGEEPAAAGAAWAVPGRDLRQPGSARRAQTPPHHPAHAQGLAPCWSGLCTRSQG